MNTQDRVNEKIAKVALKNQQVDLGLREAEGLINQIKSSDKLLEKAKQSYKELQKEAISQASLTAKAISELEGINNKLSDAYKEAKDIKSTMEKGGISTAALDARISQIRDAGNDLGNNLRELQNMNNSFRRI